MPAMTLLAILTGGVGDGRRVDIPLDSFPAQLDFVTGAGAVLYERVGYTSTYRPATVLDALVPPVTAPTATAPAKPATTTKKAPRKKTAASPAFVDATG